MNHLLGPDLARCNRETNHGSVSKGSTYFSRKEVQMPRGQLLKDITKYQSYLYPSAPLSFLSLVANCSLHAQLHSCAMTGGREKQDSHSPCQGRGSPATQTSACILLVSWYQLKLLPS